MWPPKSILHPTDFSAGSEHAFEYACRVARQTSGKLILLHAHYPMIFAGGDMPPLAVEVENETDARKRLDSIPTHVGVVMERLMVTGSAPEVILEQAKHLQADLIIMGTHGRRGINRLLLGSVTEQVLRRAECPVLTIKPEAS